jgi:hypothetical protein
MWTSCQWQSKKDEQLEKVGNPLWLSFSASCKQFSLKVVIFVSINWQEELSLKNVGPGGQGGIDWQDSVDKWVSTSCAES